MRHSPDEMEEEGEKGVYIDTGVKKMSKDDYDNYWQKKEYNMQNGGSINPSDVATLSQLGGGYGGGYGLGRGGYSGGGYGTREPFDGTVVNTNVERNAADIAMQNQFGRDTTKEQGQFTRETVKEQGVEGKLLAILTNQSDLHIAEINGQNQQHIQTMRDIADSRAEAAACCCETQKLVLSENNATRTLLLEQRIAEQSDDIAAARLGSHNDAVLQQMALQTQLLTALINKDTGHHGH